MSQKILKNNNPGKCQRTTTHIRNCGHLSKRKNYSNQELKN